MDFIAGTKVARKKGVTQGTHQKRACSWDIWLVFLMKIKNTVTPIWKTSMKLDDYAFAVFSCIRCDEVILGEFESSSMSKDPLQEYPLIM